MKKMKKVLAGLLATSMVMSMSVMSFADTTGNATTTYNLKTASNTYNAVIKTYTINGSTDSVLYPTETLKFVSTAAITNPDVIANKDVTDYEAKNLTIAPLVVAGNAEQRLSITVPELTEVGTYHFAIKEIAGNAQGVVYDTATEIAVSVLVEYDYTDADADGNHLKATIGITQANNTKNSTITNIYNVGSLVVSKTVTGNLGDKSKYFDITVEFTSDQPVESKITVSGGSEASNPTEILETEWVLKSDKYTYTKVIKLKHGESLTFNNIPDGVTYTVVESDEYSKDTDKNGVNGYDAPVYANSDNDVITTGSGSIATEVTTAEGTTTYTPDSDTIGITNNKTTTVDTGISLDSMPYLMTLALSAFGALGFVSKKRKEEDEI